MYLSFQKLCSYRTLLAHLSVFRALGKIDVKDGGIANAFNTLP